MLRRLSFVTALLICATPALAQQYKNVPHLGGPAAFHKPRLTNAASLKRMAEREASDIRIVMRDAGIPEVSDALIAAMSKGTSTLSRGNCSAVAPGDDLVECTEPSGATYEWMAYRQLVKGKRQRVPARLAMARYTGKGAFVAFLVRVTVSDKRYTFIVPKACSNISLVSVGADQAAVDRAARDQAARDQAAREQAARDQAAREQAARDQAARDQAARDQAARDQAAREQAARDQAAREQAARDQAARDQVARNNAPGQGGAGQAGQAGSAAQAAGVEKTWPPDNPSSPFFFDALLGGETRNRPADLSEGKPGPYTQGSGHIGLRIGVHKKFESKWEIGATFGLAAVFLFDRNTTNQWPWFIDTEVNHYFGRAFIGTGVSFWDITRSDLWTPAADARFGLPLGHHPSHPIYFIGEGRWMFWNRTNLDTHRQMWAGLRFDF